MEINHIVLDLGGVVVRVEDNLTFEAFRALGTDNVDEAFQWLIEEGFFDRFQTGEVSVDEFHEQLQGVLYPPPDPEWIIQAWNAMLIDIPKSHVDLILDMRLQGKVSCLSNTNPIHVARINQMLSEEHGIDGLSVLFDQTFLSHELGLRKPDAEIFQRVVELSGIPANETYFIDDLQEHIDAAAALDIHTLRSIPNQSLSDTVEMVFDQL